MRYICDDGQAKIEIEANTAAEAAQEYVDDGDYHRGEQTTWIHVWVHPVDDDLDRDCYRIELHPVEPDCTAPEHDWRELGDVWASPSGLGVVVTERCTHCGERRRVDTGAVDMVDGTRGHTSYRYVTVEQ